MSKAFAHITSFFIIILNLTVIFAQRQLPATYLEDTIILHDHVMPLNFDVVYPESAFHKVETLCKELWSDLEVLHANEHLRKEWIVLTDYLADQFLALYLKVDVLVNHPEESRIYLTEDLYYLLGVFAFLETRYTTLVHAIAQDNPAMLDVLKDMDRILVESKAKLEGLMHSNLEYTF